MSSLLQSVTCHGKKNKLTRNPEQQRRDILLRCYLSGKELQFNIGQYKKHSLSIAQEPNKICEVSLSSGVIQFTKTCALQLYSRSIT